MGSEGKAVNAVTVKEGLSQYVPFKDNKSNVVSAPWNYVKIGSWFCDRYYSLLSVLYQNIGWPDSVHYPRVTQNSTINKKYSKVFSARVYPIGDSTYTPTTEDGSSDSISWSYFLQWPVIYQHKYGACRWNTEKKTSIYKNH
jgi:hypothetical protein